MIHIKATLTKILDNVNEKQIPTNKENTVNVFCQYV